MSQKTFFIIPGFKQQATDKGYGWLIKLLRGKGYKVVLVPVNWNFKVLSKNAEEIADVLKLYPTEEKYILGFSFGAVLIMLIANQFKFKKIFLCSISPVFLEDTKSMSPEIRKYIGKRRYIDTQTRSALNIAKTINTPTTIFYGQKEAENFPQLKKRCRETSQLIPESKLVIIKNAPHQIDASNYKLAIQSEIGLLED